MASSGELHATGAPKLILTKRTKPLHPSSLPPSSTPANPWSSRPSSSLSSSSSFSSSPPSSSSPSPSSSPSSSTFLSWRSRSSSPPSTSPPKTQAHWATTGNWRSGSRPKRLSTPATPAFDELLKGQVLWLGHPPCDSILWQHPELSAPQGHPVVVVGKHRGKDGEACVRFRVVTSFGGMRLQDKKPQHQWRYFMLCENSQEQPSLDEVRFAKTAPGSGVFNKRCYVNLSANSIHCVEYKHLGVFTPQPSLRFDKESTAKIQQAPANY